MLPTDPYAIARQNRRFGMPYGLSSQTSQGGYPTPAQASAYSTRGIPRTPVPGRLGAPLAAIPASGTMGQNPQAFQEGKQQQEKLQQQGAENTAAMNRFKADNNAQGARDQAASVAAYRQARDTSPGAIQSRELRQEAGDLGIDPSSSPRDVADAMNGGPGTTPYNLDPTKPATDSPGVVQATPDSIRTAMLQRQAQKDGAQRTAVDNSYAQGRTGSSTGTDPYDASKTPNAPAVPPAGSVPDPENADTTDANQPGSPAAPVVYNPGKAVKRKNPQQQLLTPPTT